MSRIENCSNSMRKSSLEHSRAISNSEPHPALCDEFVFEVSFTAQLSERFPQFQHFRLQSHGISGLNESVHMGGRYLEDHGNFAGHFGALQHQDCSKLCDSLEQYAGWDRRRRRAKAGQHGFIGAERFDAPNFNTWRQARHAVNQQKRIAVRQDTMDDGFEALRSGLNGLACHLARIGSRTCKTPYPPVNTTGLTTF